ncbi:hypothetical protein PF005_g20768 [Phytophthora fragariae]|uniref:Uncharacterized protein n=1 Tax=Phytophthora fragariae TaxID=53985 RepID=A0A6A3R109_9STRA|nr:hypothetical protein PF007_g20742 [Phytophthora fragariae]KAE9186643.1 hypothetical protein PF005_g20768 [Phytophthora fragariae]
MPHAIAQAQGAIRAVGAALGFDSSRPGEATSVVAPPALGEPSSDAPPADTDPAGAVGSAPPSSSASPSEDASTEVLSSPVVTQSPSAGVPPSPTPVLASAYGALGEPQAADTADTPGESAASSEASVLEAASGSAGQVPPTPVRPSAGGAVLDLAAPPSLTSPRQRCPSPVSPPNSPHDSSRFCRTLCPPSNRCLLPGSLRQRTPWKESSKTRLTRLRLEGAHDLDTIVHAIAPGANTPPANWDTEMEILRVDVRYHRDQLRDRRGGSGASRGTRRGVPPSCPRCCVSSKSADVIDLLKTRIGRYDKKIEEARTTIRNDRLKIKKGLSDLTSCLKTLRQYLEARQRDRESGCLVDHGTDTTLPEGFQVLLDQVRSIQLHPTETSAGSKRPANSSAAAAHANHESDSSSDESSEDSDVVFIEPPTKRRKRSSTSPKSKKKRSSSHSASKVRPPSHRKSRLDKLSVDLRSKSGSSTAEGANPAPPSGHAGVSSGVAAESQGLASDQSAPVAPPPSALPAVTVPSSTAGCTPPPSPRRPEASAASPSPSGPPPATPGAATFARGSLFEAAVVIPPRRDGRPVRPASTVASLQSKSAVERENAPDAVVLGSNPSGSSSSARSVAGQDAGDGFVYGSPSMTFETMVIGPKARARKPAKAVKAKATKAKSSKAVKPPNAAKPPRVVKHSVPSRKPRSSPSSRALRPEEEEDDEVLSEGNLSDASAASGSSKRPGSKHSSLTHAPLVQSDDGGAGAEEADASAGSAAEDEESPDESASKPPRAAIRLDILATVATTSK